jgi:hypothetical protein
MPTQVKSSPIPLMWANSRWHTWRYKSFLTPLDILKVGGRPGVMAHACNHRYSGVRDQKDPCSMSAWTKSESFSSTNKQGMVVYTYNSSYTECISRRSSVWGHPIWKIAKAEVLEVWIKWWGLEFKPQYWKKKKKFEGFPLYSCEIPEAMRSMLN